MLIWKREHVPPDYDARHQDPTEASVLLGDLRCEEAWLVFNWDQDHPIFPIQLDNLLGWPSYPSSQLAFQKLIQPEHRVVWELYSQAIVDFLSNPPVPISPLQLLLVGGIAFQTKSQGYLYCKVELYAGQPLAGFLPSTAYIRLSSVKSWKQEPPFLRIPLTIKGQFAAEQWLSQHLVKLHAGKKLFSTQELRMLKLYAKNSRITSARIADRVKVKAVTVQKYNQRILQKFETHFQSTRDTASNVALFLHHAGLV